MTPNRNPWVAKLLSWHSHDKGGVKVPFRVGSGNPLGFTVRTDLTERLDQLASDIANGLTETRWVFLVGGPGNGKSEDVQYFLEKLDRYLGCAGALISQLKENFSVGRTPRKVSISLLPIIGFTGRVNEVTVVQDATANDTAFQDAAGQLVKDLQALVAAAGTTVFICCVNRGLLARALRTAEKEQLHAVAELLEKVSRATALSMQSAGAQGLPCWPLDDRRAACWPLDLETLIEGPDGGPFLTVLEEAVKAENWDTPGACLDCKSRQMCPFFYNALQLSQPTIRENVQTFLRCGELASGKRLNFREIFSIVAELVVGEWGDFLPHTHPCDWLHNQQERMDDFYNPTDGAEASFLVLRRLFHQALFPVTRSLGLIQDTRRWPKGVALRLSNVVKTSYKEPSTPVRKLLAGTLSPRIDPVLETPADREHKLRWIEDACSHSLLHLIEDAQDNLHPAHLLFLQRLTVAEAEARDKLKASTARAAAIVRFTRRLAVESLKRTFGVLEGYYADQKYLTNYRALINDSADVQHRTELQDSVRDLLGQSFDMLSTLGQATAHSESLVVLSSGAVGATVIPPLPRQKMSRNPYHDLPRLDIGSTGQLPLTFDLYKALCLRAEGCVENSLPAPVRASFDRIRQIKAGALCKENRPFVDGTATIKIGALGQIVFDATTGKPRFIPSRGGDVR